MKSVNTTLFMLVNGVKASVHLPQDGACPLSTPQFSFETLDWMYDVFPRAFCGTTADGLIM